MNDWLMLAFWWVFPGISFVRWRWSKVMGRFSKEDLREYRVAHCIAIVAVVLTGPINWPWYLWNKRSRWLA